MTSDSTFFLPLSAESRKELQEKKVELLALLREAEASLSVISEKLLSEKPSRYRVALVASEHEEATQLLESTDENDILTPTKIVFAFPGQGASGAIPLKYLRECNKEFDFYISKAEAFLSKENISLEKILTSWKHDSSVEEQLFSYIFSFAMAKQYISYGIIPDILIGHSLGEITAAAFSNIIDFEETLKYVHERAKLIDGLKEKGVTCSLKGSAKDIEKLLLKEKELSLAAINSDNLYIVSAREKAMKKAEGIMDMLGIGHKRLPLAFAAHSSLLDPILPEIEDVRVMNIREGDYPIYSSVNGVELKAEELREAKWWSAHARNTVSFAKALKSLKKNIKPSKAAVVEFGVHRVLMSAGKELLKDSYWNGCCSMAKYHENKSTEYCYKRGIMETVSYLWQLGAAVDLRQINDTLTKVK